MSSVWSDLERIVPYVAKRCKSLLRNVLRVFGLGLRGWLPVVRCEESSISLVPS